jgi:hypothetical protein
MLLSMAAEERVGRVSKIVFCLLYTLVVRVLSVFRHCYHCSALVHLQFTFELDALQS